MKVTQQIQIQTYFCFMMTYIVFLVGVQRVENDTICTIITIVLQYLLLTSWCWKAVYSSKMYQSLVQVGTYPQTGFFRPKP